MSYLPSLLSGAVRLMVGAQPRWVGTLPSEEQRIYFANHTSHLDALAIWSALPSELRLRTRPVAARDYWDKTRFRRYISQHGFRAVYLDRKPGASTGKREHPLCPLFEALDSGDSLIIFPEGTRNCEALPQSFKPGLHHLAERYPQVSLVPVYLENLYRCMPKGKFWPLPLICTVRFGTTLERREAEPKATFLERARQEVINLA